MDSSPKVLIVGCGVDLSETLPDMLHDCDLEVEAEYPDVRSAIDRIRLSQGENRLCMLHLKSEAELQPLNWLSRTLVGRPLVALLDSSGDPGLIFAANRAGAEQVLPLPLRPEDLRAALDSVRLRHAPAEPVSTRRVIAVAGVTGGCGATTIAINLAHEISHLLNLSCILVELSTHLGMLAVLLNISPRRTTYNLFCDIGSVTPQFVEQTLTRVTDRFSVLVAPYQDVTPLAATSQDILTVIDCVKQLADVVVLDVPSNHHDAHVETFAAADHVVLVAEQAVPSLRALDFVAKKLNQQANSKPQTLVINRYNPTKAGFSVGHLHRLLQTPELVTVRNDYAAVSAAVNEGRPLRLQAPRSPVLADIESLARTLILPRLAHAPQSAQPSFFRRFLRALFGL